MQEISVNKIQIFRFEWNYINTNMYVIESEDSILVIDPVETEETQRFWRDREKCIANITVFLTHEHFDHINGLNYLRSKFTCMVISSESCSKNITNPRKNLSEYSYFMKEMNEDVRKSEIEIQPFVCKPADIICRCEIKTTWMGHGLQLIRTPGHTQGSICVIFDEKIVFTGDSLLRRPIITKLPGGCKKDYMNVTRKKLLTLLKQVEIVCPGHGEPDIADRFEKFI
jgi:Zn-dependent hydrolases, including glyoxylases